MKHFIHTKTGSRPNWSQPDPNADQQTDHPERMLFFAFVGAILCWTTIGLMGWGVWALMQ